MSEPLDPLHVSIMLIDDQPERLATVEAKLQESGFDVVACLATANGLLFQIEQHQPDIVIIDLQSPGRDVLESLAIVNHHSPKPVVMFSEEEDPNFISEAVEAGVTAYLMHDFNPKKVKPVIDLAFAQFRTFQTLRRQLDDTRSALATRSVVEEAKALLMQHHSIDEDKAHNTLRTLAMDTNQSLAEAATSIIKILDKKK